MQVLINKNDAFIFDAGYLIKNKIMVISSIAGVTGYNCNGMLISLVLLSG